MSRFEVVKTRGGMLAMRGVEAGEVMHPGVGPLIEAQRLYIDQSRLREQLAAASRGPEELVLFDIGMGAGTNGLLARKVARDNRTVARLHLVSFERDLGALQLALDYPDAFGFDEESKGAARVLLEQQAHHGERVTWTLRHGDVLHSLKDEPLRADLVFWDPFSPSANPLLWTVQAFALARAAAGPRCTLYTYSASTTTRVALLLAGWAVGIGAAIGDKRETTAAAVDVTDLQQPLDQRWLERLVRSSAPLPSDAPANAREVIAQMAQFTSS